MSIISNDIIDKSINKAFKGGISGSSAMIVQVTSLMWLRTTMNYQYANGTTMTDTFKTLYKNGGIKRFYKGYSVALLQGPLSRFGDTAANMGVLELTKDMDIPIYQKTALASITAASWRFVLMPIDATKTTLQVHGKDGMNVLKNRIKSNGVKTLWNGTTASMSATMIGHYPWFITYNYLNSLIDTKKQVTQLEKLSKQAGIGLCASIVSDVSSNSIRVVKTIKQTSLNTLGYTEIVKNTIKNDSLNGLFFRGLKTRILANGINGMMFSVMWKYFMDN